MNTDAWAPLSDGTILMLEPICLTAPKLVKKMPTAFDRYRHLLVLTLASQAGL